MNLFRLLFDDEGEISRAQWWIGVGCIVLAHVSLQIIAALAPFPLGLDRAFLTFVGIALVLPFHAVNAKRFRAMGHSPLLALPAAAIGVASGVLNTLPLGVTAPTITGIAGVIVWLWYVVHLGLLERIKPVRYQADQIALIARGRRTA